MSKGLRMSKGMPSQKSSMRGFGSKKKSGAVSGAGMNTMEQAPNEMSDYARMVAAGGGA